MPRLSSRGSSLTLGKEMKLLAALICSALLSGCASVKQDDRSYLWKMIACDDSEEEAVGSVYIAYLRAIQGEAVEPGVTRVPLRKVEVTNAFVIASIGYYISPNGFRGFELAFPKDSVELKDGNYVLKERLILAKQSFKSEIHLIELKKPNQPPEPTAPSGRGSP